MASLNGTWKLIKIEKFEEFMKAIDVNEENIQKGLKLLTPENDIKQEISVEGDKVCIKTVTPLSTQEHKGNIGQEFDQPGWDGRPVKVRYG
ncbi:hypothetical protein FSP39_010564 [Pinctada imbricata]|uniref:Lipocalin/cytosolic fatty-acid binding domain-containing protein n=1 Tax=Pinctada imbricata TaxID=66713 RepID=A0AA88XFQ6_PINIB|nr:hypothetical protein FSP39_010564 [Pinctada imbricata]